MSVDDGDYEIFPTGGEPIEDAVGFSGGEKLDPIKPSDVSDEELLERRVDKRLLAELRDRLIKIGIVPLELAPQNIERPKRYRPDIHLSELTPNLEGTILMDSLRRYKLHGVSVVGAPGTTVTATHPMEIAGRKTVSVGVFPSGSYWYLPTFREDMDYINNNLPVVDVDTLQPSE